MYRLSWKFPNDGNLEPSSYWLYCRKILLWLLQIISVGSFFVIYQLALDACSLI